jgi:hypothetical protein
MPDVFVIPGGKLYFDELDDAGAATGERYLGNSQSANLATTPQKLATYDNEDGIAVKADEVVTQIDRIITARIRNVDVDNIALFAIADRSTRTQKAGEVTDHAVGPVQSDRYYQLGASTSNPSGERGTTVSAVSSAEGDAASAHATETTYAIGDAVIPAEANDHWYMATTAGDSAAVAPTWPTDGSTVVDGDITWQDMGLIAYTVTTDYTADADLGRIYVVPGGAIATAAALAEASGAELNLNVDYTRAANTRDQVIALSGNTKQGALRVIASNLKGPARDYYFPKCNVTPTGDLTLKGDPESQAYQELTFEIEVLKRDDNTAPMYIDGRTA